MADSSSLILPEINISNPDDWTDMNFLKPQPQPQPQTQQTQPSLPSSALSSLQGESLVAETETETAKEEVTDKSNATNSSSIVNSPTTTTNLSRTLSLPRQSKEECTRKEVINIATSNPSHLFWVPASQHPEIAPTEFEKYVSAHGLMLGKKSIRRRQSVLSVYFTANDQQQLLDELSSADTTTTKVEKDRNESLDALERGGDNNEVTSSPPTETSKARKLLLRRSVSLQLPTAGGYARNVPDLLVFDRNSSPLDESRALVPKADKPLTRRGARTNFKRNSSVTSSPQRPNLAYRRSESDCDNNEKETDDMSRSTSAEGVTLTDGNDMRTDAQNLDQAVPIATTTTPPQVLESLTESVEEPRELSIATRETVKEKNQDKKLLDFPIMTRSLSTSTPTSSATVGRKHAWSWAFWSDEKSSKKNKIDPALQTAENSEDNQQEPSLKSPESGSPFNINREPSNKRFTFTSLFSRKNKNSHNSHQHHTNSASIANNNSSSSLISTASKDFQLNRFNMTRLPLHVERAVYKLSHIKLANPRRPLHEQVLISNQMFWYLSIIAQNNDNFSQQQQHMVEQHYQQQIILNKKNSKKKRLTKKKQQQQPSSLAGVNNSQRMSSPHHYYQPPKPNSITGNSAPTSGESAHFMASHHASREQSTGFVVPENYLNPKNSGAQTQRNKPTVTARETGADKMKAVLLQSHRRATTPTYSDSSSDEEEEKKESGRVGDSSDDDDDDMILTPTAHRKKLQQRHAARLNEKEDDNVPLAMYNRNFNNK